MSAALRLPFEQVGVLLHMTTSAVISAKQNGRDLQVKGGGMGPGQQGRETVRRSRQSLI